DNEMTLQESDILRRFEKLQSFSTYAEWPRSDLLELAARLEEELYGPGEVIFRAHTPARVMYIVAEGNVREWARDEQGRPWLDRTVGPGTHLGARTLLSARPTYATNGEAHSQVIVFTLGAADLGEMLQRRPELRDALMHPGLARRLRAMPLLSVIPDERLVHLSDCFTQRDFAPGQAIPPTPGLWLIDSGQVTIEEAGELPPLLTAGNFFVTTPFPIAPLRTVKATALTEVKLFHVPTNMMGMLIHAHPEMRSGLKQLTTSDFEQFFKQVDFLADLDAELKRGLMGYFGWHHYPPDVVVTRQGEPGDELFILQRGSAIVRATDERGRRRPQHFMRPGDAFGHRSLLEGGRRQATVQATQAREEAIGVIYPGADFLILHHADLEHLIAQNPRAWAGTFLRQSLERRVVKHPFPWQQEEEVLVEQCHRHWVVLVRNMVEYAGMIAIPTAALLLAVSLLLEWPWAPAPALIFTGVVGLLGVIPAWINYRDDYFVVTNLRVTHRERVVLLYESRVEAPLEQVQDVTVNTNLLGRLLHYGDLTVRTAAPVGNITFTYTPDPGRIRDAIFMQRAQVRAQREAERRERLRTSLQETLELALLPKRPRRVIPMGSPILHKGWLARFGSWLQGYSPRRERTIPKSPGFYLIPRFVWRDGDTITWRKHWIDLIRRTGLPLAIVFALMALGLAAYVAGFINLRQWPTAGMYLAIVLAAISWLWYQYEDWRNDVYILTSTSIIDVEKRPLAMREDRREGTLDRVQNVSFEIPSTLAY
ncbi:MAG TPA: cyclic nucleotide-binding domain-containing protein, partial [Anaerolineae bacterium]|nr:cyclic nucleotide-binding domain-containing protein [Anaerolineae bacterium]